MLSKEEILERSAQAPLRHGAQNWQIKRDLEFCQLSASVV